MMLFWIAGALALTLDDAWKATLESSQEATLLEESNQQAGLNETLAWLSLGPRVSFAGNYTINQREVTMDFSKSFPDEVLTMIESFTGEPVDFGDPLVIQEKSYFDANLSIIQPLLNLKAFPGLRAAQAMDEIGEAQYQAGIAQLKLGATQLYNGLLLARANEKLATDAVTLTRKHFEATQTMVQTGSAPELARLQAEAAVARAERDQLSATARRRQVEDAFVALTGIKPLEDLSRPQVPSFPYTTQEAALSRALDQRPELLTARAQLTAAQASALVSKLGWAPTIDARFTQAWTENAGFSGENSTWMFVVSANWLLWDAGYRLTDNQRTASQAVQAQTAAEKLIEETATLLHQLWLERERSELSLQVAHKELAANEAALKASESGWSQGAGTFLDLEDARLRRDGSVLSVLSEELTLVYTSLQILALTGDL